MALLAAGWCACGPLLRGTAFFGPSAAPLRGSVVATALSQKQPVMGTGLFSTTRAARRGGLVARAAGADEIKFWTPGFGPYSQRVWITLLEKGLPFDFIKIDLEDKPADFVEMYRGVNPAVDAPAKVPMIKLSDGFTMIESTVIVDYLIESFKGKGEPLTPESIEQRSKVRLFIQTYDQTLGAVGDLLLRASGEAEKAMYVEMVKSHLQTLDAFLKLHGTAGGPFLCGETFSLAEIHAAPFLSRAITNWEHFQDVKLLGLCDELGLSRLKEWIEATTKRPSVAETSESAEELIDQHKWNLVWEML